MAKLACVSGVCLFAAVTVKNGECRSAGDDSETSGRHSSKACSR